MMDLLTSCAAIVDNHSAINALMAGFRSLESIGVKTPNHGVFLCFKEMVTAKIRNFYVMVARSGQPRGWPAPMPGTANLLRVAAKCFAAVGGGYQSSALESTAMNKPQSNHAQNPGNDQTTTQDDKIFYFFVTHPVVIDGQKYPGKPLSPNFRTRVEAENYRTDQGLDVAICCQVLFVDDDASRAEMEALVFDGTNPSVSVGYVTENSLT